MDNLILSEYFVYFIFLKKNKDTPSFIGRAEGSLDIELAKHLNGQCSTSLYFKKEDIDRILFDVFPTQADANMYEIYYIQKYQPELNSGYARDKMHVTLPERELIEY